MSTIYRYLDVLSVEKCIDNINDEELSGRIYHCYSKEPWKFTNILQLIELADDFFDNSHRRRIV